MSGTQKINQLKREYIEYFKDVPIQKYAAMYIARDEDTIIRWKNEDADFADSVQRSKAEWIRKRFLTTRPEFALEKLEKAIFGKDVIGDETTLPPVYVYYPKELPYDIVNTPMKPASHDNVH